MSFHADTCINNTRDNVLVATYFFAVIVLSKMESTHNVDTVQSHQNDASSKVNLMMHHQFPGIELASLLYYSNGATCCLLPDQCVDVDSMMQTDFNIDLT
jgi:hypothetical protein